MSYNNSASSSPFFKKTRLDPQAPGSRLQSLKERFSYGSLASPSVSPIPPYTSSLGSLDNREKVVAQQLQSIFPRIPSTMVQYAVRKKGTFQNAADWLEDQNFLGSVSENKASPISKQNSLNRQQQAKPQKSILQKFGSASSKIRATDNRLSTPSSTASPAPVKKRRLFKGSNSRSTALVLSDDDVSNDSNYSDESDEEGKFNDRVLNLINTASLEDIVDIASTTSELAQLMIKSRPFKSLENARKVDKSSGSGKPSRSRKTIGGKIIDECYKTLKGFEAVDSLIKRCEVLGKQVADDISKWGVSILGEKSEGLDLTSVNCEDTPEKDSADDDNNDEDDEDDVRPNTRKRVRTELSNTVQTTTYFKEKPVLLAPEITLKTYQQVGINWLSLLYQRRLSCILADEMGLGKTCQVVSFLAHLKEIGIEGPHLIVVPSSTLENWLREFQKFCPSFLVEPYYGTQNERAIIRDSILSSGSPKYDVMVTTYNLACSSSADYTFLKHQKFNVCVYDEGHLLKNSQSERYAKLMRLKANFRLLLTGTPLQNNLRELISLLTFILPDIFSSKKEDLAYIFKHKATTTTKNNQDFSNNPLLSEQRIIKAKTMMTPFVLRRKKEQVLSVLPPKTHKVEFCDMTKSQASIYEKEFNISKSMINNMQSDKKKKIGNVLMNLRKAALHPLLFREIYNDSLLKTMSKEIMKEPCYYDAKQEYIFEDMQVMTDSELDRLCHDFKSISSYSLSEDEWLNSGKIIKLMDMLPKMKAQGDRILIFSQFTQVLDILEKVMNILNIQFLRMDGSTPVDSRQDMIDRFYEDEDITVFMLSTKAGGFGINLTCANVVIIHDLSFNPNDDKQAEDRAHRVGQTKPVNVIRLITRNTIEENILDLANIKLALDKSVNGEDDKATIDNNENLIAEKLLLK